MASPKESEPSSFAAASTSREPTTEPTVVFAGEASPVATVPTEGGAPIEAAVYDPGDDDADSALGHEDRRNSTASLSASILEYRTLNGRTYHSARHGSDKYWGPNDNQQNEAMDMNHHLLTLCLEGKLFLAPLKNDIKKVLDIGTATGLWAIDMADQFPNCEVIGTDLSPIQPPWHPPNVRFEIDDAEREWTFAPGSLDYVHVRYMLGGVLDWPRLFRQAFAALRPGGWVESFEVEPECRSDDGTVRPGSAMAMWYDLFVEGGERLGRPFTVLTDDIQARGIADAGFADITVKEFKIPMGEWPGDPKLRETGRWAQYTLEEDLEGYVMFIWNTVLGRPLDEMQVFLMNYRRELRDKRIHAYLPQRVVYARKPETV